MVGKIALLVQHHPQTASKLPSQLPDEHTADQLVTGMRASHLGLTN